MVKKTGNTENLGHAELCWIANVHKENQCLKPQDLREGKPLADHRMIW